MRTKSAPARGTLGPSRTRPFHDSLSTVRSCPDRAIDSRPAGCVPSSVRRATSFTRRFAHDAPSNSRVSISARSSAGRRSFVPTHSAQRARSASRSLPRAIAERWPSSVRRKSTGLNTTIANKRDGRASMSSTPGRACEQSVNRRLVGRERVTTSRCRPRPRARPVWVR